MNVQPCQESFRLRPVGRRSGRSERNDLASDAVGEALRADGGEELRGHPVQRRARLAIRGQARLNASPDVVESISPRTPVRFFRRHNMR